MSNKVSPGDPLVIGARTWNRLLDSIGEKNDIVANKEKDDLPYRWVWAYNDLTEAIPRYQPAHATLATGFVGPSPNYNGEFYRGKYFKIIQEIGNQAHIAGNKQTVVALETIQPDKWGKVAIRGIVPCRVRTNRNAGEYAHWSNDKTTFQQSFTGYRLVGSLASEFGYDVSLIDLTDPPRRRFVVLAVAPTMLDTFNCEWRPTTQVLGRVDDVGGVLVESGRKFRLIDYGTRKVTLFYYINTRTAFSFSGTEFFRWHSYENTLTMTNGSSLPLDDNKGTRSTCPIADSSGDDDVASFCVSPSWIVSKDIAANPTKVKTDFVLTSKIWSNIITIMAASPSPPAIVVSRSSSSAFHPGFSAETGAYVLIEWLDDNTCTSQGSAAWAQSSTILGQIDSVGGS